MRNRRVVQTTIIKRSARKGHSNGVHSGAWKVAFADFTLAMMALFMVLWIINAVSEEERKQIMAQINGTSIFEANPFSPISTTADFMVGKDMIPVREDALPEIQPKSMSTDDGEVSTLLSLKQSQSEQLQLMNKEPLEDVLERSREEMEELAMIIMKITEAHNAQSNLQMEIIPQGLRILLQDDQHQEMFQRGSAKLTVFFRNLLQELAPVLQKIHNKVVITGHTDATQYPDGVHYNNWNLSGERAMAAMQALEQGGMPAQQVIQVSGMADQMLLDEKNPEAMSNRRIEIMILTKTASDTLYQFFSHDGERITPSTTRGAPSKQARNSGQTPTKP